MSIPGERAVKIMDWPYMNPILNIIKAVWDLLNRKQNNKQNVWRTIPEH